jgi:hypothetical protein
MPRWNCAARPIGNCLMPATWQPVAEIAETLLFRDDVASLRGV